MNYFQAFSLFCFLLFSADGFAGTISLQNKNTLSPLEMNRGDTLRFTLNNGRAIEMILLSSSSKIVFTTLEDPKTGGRGEGTIYKMSCRVKIDGQEMEMQRIIPVQETFTVPYLVNGCYIWFDGLKSAGDQLNENHGECLPRKDARFALWDATGEICPETLEDWYPNGKNYIDVRDCYNGDDTWLGTYFGADLHGGLDINMPVGTPLFAPVDFDDHYYFESLETGANNNRWRGIKRWENGDTWILQTHHLIELLIPEHQKISKGEKYAYSAGVLAGDHPHTHFVFKVIRDGTEYMLDPWLLFWKIFEDNKKQSNSAKAVINPLSAAKTGQEISFSSEGSRAGVAGFGPSCYWSFGDGTFSIQKNPAHTYLKPGIYPVTLVTDDGITQEQTVQLVTVNGEDQEKNGLGLTSGSVPGFQIKEVSQAQVYGRQSSAPVVKLFGRTSHQSDTIRLQVINTGHGNLPESSIHIHYLENANRIEYFPNHKREYHPGHEWLNVEISGSGNNQQLLISATCKGMEKGETLLHAFIGIDAPGAANSPQMIPVTLEIPDYFDEPPASEITVDNDSEFTFKTSHCWVSPRMYSFEKGWSDGCNGSYLINIESDSTGSEFVRYRPDLEEGVYQISFSEKTPFDKIAAETGRKITIPLRIHSADKVHFTEVNPLETLEIGQFRFETGKKGFADILAPNNGNLSVADAIIFKKIKP